jgi:two-component system, LuxR family, sensor kinase FixL
MSAISGSDFVARGMSISQRLTLIVLTVAIPLLILSAIIVWRLAGYEREQSRRAILYASRPIMATVDAQLGKYMAAVQALAASQSLQEGDLVGFRSEAEQALPGLSGAWVMLADAQGRQLVDTLVSGPEPPLILSEEEREVAVRGLETGRMQVSNALMGGYAKFPMVSVGVPITVGDKPMYFLSIHVDVAAFRALLNSQGLPEGWIVSVIDRGDKIITRSRDHELWAGRLASVSWQTRDHQEGISETFSLENQPVIYATAISALSGWTIVVAAEKNALDAPIRQTILSALLVSLVVTVLSMLFAALAARKITAPIGALERGARALQHREPVCLAATGVPEFDRALFAFDAASKELLSYEEQRARTEMALRSSEARLSLFVEQAPASIAMFDRNMRYIAASRRFLLQHGIEEQDVVGRSLAEVSPNIDPNWRDRHWRGLSGEELHGDDDKFVRTDGQTQWLSWAIRPWRTRDGDVGGVVFFVEDVTRRHEVTEALKESEERLRLLIDGIKDYAVFMLDPSGHVASWNDGARRIKGYDADEIIGRHFSVFHTPEDINTGKPERGLEIALRTGAYEEEGEQVKKSGERIWASTLVNALYSGTGMLKGFARITRDITERKMAEVALVTSETLLRAVVDGSPDAIIAIGPSGIIQSINKNGVSMFGYERQELVGRNINIVLPEHFQDLHRDMQEYLETGERQIIDVSREVEGLRKDGTIFPLGLMITQTTYADAPLFVGFLRDLSSRREIEVRIKQLQGERLSAMGGLAAGLAHELNQPLAAAVTYLQTAQLLLGMPTESQSNTVEETVGRAVDEIMRAGQIIKRLRELVTNGEPDKTFLNLHDFINEVPELAMQRDGKIGVRLRLNAENDNVLADRVQIKQVLANLIRNATEAMTPSTERMLSVSTSLFEPGMIQVDVADTGAGFQPGIRERLFEPFQTTKSSGMGIGLSISRMIVEAHYGKIWAEPNPEGGAIFSFTLPLVNMEADHDR